MACKFVFKNIKLRFVSVLIFAACSLVVWNLNSSDKSIPTRYLAHLQPEPKTMFQDRDMSNYDFGGRIVSCFNNFDIPTKDCQLLKKQAREFIYQHWQDKKRAYIILEFNCDACKEIHFFIEPNENGNWHIVWREEFSNFERGFSTNISNELMTSVKYKIAKDASQGFVTGTKYLSFLNKDGKEIGLF